MGVLALSVMASSVPTNVALLAVRVFLGVMIFLHGYRKFFGGGKIAGTTRWFESIGMRSGRLNALVAASTEVGVGVLLTLGLLSPLAAAGLISLMVVAITTVHAKNGFFIFNKGEGYEYTLSVAIMALVPGVIGPGRYSLDYAWHVLSWSTTTRFLVTVILGVGGAALQLLAFYRPTESA